MEVTEKMIEQLKADLSKTKTCDDLMGKDGANFRLNILTELKNRGVEDIFIASIDGLKGFPDTINSVFPQTGIQLCVIHQIKNTLKYIVSKDQKKFMKKLKEVFKAPTEEAALLNLDKLDENRGNKYSLAIKS